MPEEAKRFSMYREVYKGEPDGRVVVLGSGPLASVTVEVVPSSLNLSESQRALIPEAVERLQAKGLVVTDGPTFRLESVRAGERLHLRLSERSYFDSVLLKQYPQWGLRSQSVAVACVTLCLDGYAVEKRSEKVASLPGYLHVVPAGNMEPPAHPLETLYAEAREELGLERHELQEVECLGLVFGEHSGIYQLVARCTVNLPFAELRERPCSGRWERADLLCAPGSPEALAGWLDLHRPNLTKAGRAALILEGRRRWGEAWAEERLS